MSSTEEMDLEMTPATKSSETEKEVQECDNSESIVIPEMNQDKLEINPVNISAEIEQKEQVECVVDSETDQDVVEKTDPEPEQQAQVKNQKIDDDDCIIISDFEDDNVKVDPRPKSCPILPMPMPIPIFIEPEYNQDELSVPMEVDGGESNSVTDGYFVIDSITISDDDSDTPAPCKIKSILKRKRSLIPNNTEYEYRKTMKPGPKCKTRYTMPSILKRSLKIPSNIEVEYTRKTKKPGPKSKTRNIGTVHQLINEAKNAGPSLACFIMPNSEDENTSTDEESEEEYCGNYESEIEEEEKPIFEQSEEYINSLKKKYNIVDSEEEIEEDSEDDCTKVQLQNTDSAIVCLDTTDEETDENDAMINNPNIEDLKNDDGDLKNNVIDDNEMKNKLLKAEENIKNYASNIENLKNDDDLENNVTDNNEVEDKLSKTEENDKNDVLDNAINPNIEDLKNDDGDLENNVTDNNKVEDKLLKTEENDKNDVLDNAINPNIEDLKNDANIVVEDRALKDYEMDETKLSKVEELESNIIISNEELNQLNNGSVQ